MIEGSGSVLKPILPRGPILNTDAKAGLGQPAPGWPGDSALSFDLIEFNDN